MTRKAISHQQQAISYQLSAISSRQKRKKGSIFSSLATRHSKLGARSLLTALLLTATLALGATQTKVLLSSSQNLANGFPDGVRASEDSVFVEGPAFARSAELPALPLCATRDGSVLWVGTAPSGDLIKVEGGKASVAHHFAEPLVTALALLPGGRLLVGTSTPAKVYRFDAATGDAVLLVEPKADYVWALLPESGSFLAATGTPGKILRIPEKGELAVVLDPSASHVRCLAKEGSRLWAGTSSPAMVYRIEGNSAFLSASLKQEEVAAIVPTAKGLYVAANEKSDTAPASKGAKPAGNGFLFFLRDGQVPEEAESFPTPILCAAAQGDGCLVGLGDGRLCASARRKLSLLANWDGGSASVLLPSQVGLEVLTVGPNALFGPAEASPPAYVSPVADLSAPAKIGRCELMGRGGQLFVRAGNAAKPGPFWSAWVPAEKAQGLPAAQYAQWKLELAPGAEVRGVSVAYRCENRPPVFKSAEVRPPGEVFVRMPGQLGDHLVREVHEKDSAFPGLAVSPASDAPPQTYYLQGFRMVSWKVEDTDGDEVRVTVQFQPTGSKSWYKLAENVSDPFYVFDCRSMPDGTYRLRLTADDTLSNPEGEAAKTAFDLADFTVDNTPPRLTLKPLAPGRLLVNAEDGTAVQAVRFSLDGKPWKTLAPRGWIPGGTKLEAEVAYPAAGDHWITVEATDPYRNQASAAWLSGSEANR